MILIEVQNRAYSFWLGNRKKIKPLQGPIKQMMLRGAHGRACPICNQKMVHYPNTLVDHTMPLAVTIEHILPRSLGGTHIEENLSTICNGCNRARGQVYSDLYLNEEAIREYVAWLLLQIEDPVAASARYPIENAHFCHRWRKMYKMNYNPSGRHSKGGI